MSETYGKNTRHDHKIDRSDRDQSQDAFKDHLLCASRKEPFYGFGRAAVFHSFSFRSFFAFFSHSICLLFLTIGVTTYDPKPIDDITAQAKILCIIAKREQQRCPLHVCSSVCATDLSLPTLRPHLQSAGGSFQGTAPPAAGIFRCRVQALELPVSHHRSAETAVLLPASA